MIYRITHKMSQRCLCKFQRMLFFSFMIFFMPTEPKFQGSLLAEGALKWNQCYTQLELELALGLKCTSLYTILWILFASVSHPYKYNICHILFDRKNLFPTQNQFTHSYLWKQTVSDIKYHMLTFIDSINGFAPNIFPLMGWLGCNW